MASNHAICEIEVRCDPEMQANCRSQEAIYFRCHWKVLRNVDTSAGRIGNIVVVVAISGDGSRNATINHRHQDEQLKIRYTAII